MTITSYVYFLDVRQDDNVEHFMLKNILRVNNIGLSIAVIICYNVRGNENSAILRSVVCTCKTIKLMYNYVNYKIKILRHIILDYR